MTLAERMARVDPFEYLEWWLANKGRMRSCSFLVSLEQYLIDSGANEVHVTGDSVHVVVGRQFATVDLPDWAVGVREELGNRPLYDYDKVMLGIAKAIAYSWGSARGLSQE